MNNEKPIRVLVLDDDRFMLEFVSHLLRDLGVSEVLVAEDGKAGLFVMSAQVSAIDLLICDIEMPGMDGIEFLRNIADQYYSGKIVLFSGVNPDLLKATERLASVRGLNVIGTLAKPVTVGSLAALLAQLSIPISRRPVLPGYGRFSRWKRSSRPWRRIRLIYFINLKSPFPTAVLPVSNAWRDGAIRNTDMFHRITSYP